MKTALKICGVKDARIAEFCDKAGVEFLGLNFVPSSSRFINLGAAMQIRKKVKKARLVGVFQNLDPKYIQKVCEKAGLDVIQLHGAEGIEEISALAELGLPIIKAIRVSSSNFEAQIKLYKKIVQYFLFDNDGGKGKTFDWQLLDTAAIKLPFFIAGGINAQNAASAIKHFRPFGLDIASGVEEDGEKVKQKFKKLYG